MRPEPTKSYHHISANFGTWWHASLPRTTKDQPIGKSMAIQAPDWNSKFLIIPPRGTVIPKPDSKIFDKHTTQQAQDRQQQDIKSTNQHMVQLAAEEAKREQEAKIAAQQPPPKLTKNQQRAQELARQTKQYDERRKKEALDRNFPRLGQVPKQE